jgi:hypothetical protein
MSARERRIAPRKACAIPLRFRVLSHFVRAGVGADVSAGSSSTGKEARQKLSGRAGIQDGQSINLSERGIYFKAHSKLSVGEPIEIYFTLPTELTGRTPEEVRCCARVGPHQSRPGCDGN